MKVKLLFNIFVVIYTTMIFNSCNPDLIPEESLYTFQDELLGEYLDTDSTLSEFSALVKKTKIAGLLNSYGSYTAFAPTNQAMREFYKLKGRKKLDDFPMDSLRLIAYDHLINGNIVNYTSFRNGRLFNLTMSDRYLSISFTPEGKTYVNKNSMIVQKDIMVYNGVIHKIDKVLDPVRSGIVEVVARDTAFKIFYQALVATGLADSLLKTIDENYSITPDVAKELEDAVITSVASERYAPRARKYGYTVLMESDETLRKNGITDLESMIIYASTIYDQVYPADAGITDITNRSNSLNRFIAYHLINKELSHSKFISDYDATHMFRTIDMYEYIETMCPNTLLEVMIKRTTGESNLFNSLLVNGSVIRLAATNFDNDASNGVYHEIDNMLVYSTDVEAMISTKRLRFDFASLFPELTNNNMRGRPSDNNSMLYRNALPLNYLERLVSNDQTVVCYTNANDKLMNYQGDEFFLTVQSGKLYDFVVTTLPVPAGTYEVRFGYQSNGRRGVAQFYVDGIPAGVPVNLNTLGTNVGIGYVKPGENPDDLNGFENDKMMRNRGYMKGPNSFKSVNESWYSGSSARYSSSNLRKILGTYEFTVPGTHEIMVKGLSGGQFQIDFIEFVPTSVLEWEDVN